MSINLNILNYKKPLNETTHVVYRDLHLDIKQKYTNNNQFHKKEEITDIVSDTNENAIKNSLFNIFSTTPGQKILNPEFGLNFEQWLFTNMSDNAALVITQTIYSQIQRWEPRITLNDVSVIPNYEQNEYNITIYYNNNQTFNINLTEAGITV